MKALLRFCALCAFLFCLPVAWGQYAGHKVLRVDIQHVGPASVSDDLIRANVHIKAGDVYLPATADDDVHGLYATGLFYNIRVGIEFSGADLILTYIVQAMPRLTDIKVTGNKKLTESKIRKKLTSKVGEPLNEQKLFSDAQAIQEMYQKSGYPGTTVEAVKNILEESGRGTVTFEIKESAKIKIIRVDFVGAQAFKEKKLRKVIKTRAHWMWSWLTGSGKFKEDQFEEDRERLAEFYREKGYIDFEIKEVKFEHPTPTSMIIQWVIYEGQPYRVGSVTFEGTTMFPTNAVSPKASFGKLPKNKAEQGPWFEQRLMNRAFPMKEGTTFTAKGMSKDIEAVQDFYGSKGHIDVEPDNGNLKVSRIANTEKGTMDLHFKVEEGQKSYVEKVEIRGNSKTKDKVIRRELTISPGEVFNMVAVKRSKARLEGLNYFDKVDARPDATDVPNRKNLIVGIDEENKRTGNLSLGAGFSSVDSIVGFVEVSQGNFDLFHPPTFTGGGQKYRLRVQIGTERQDYLLSFIEPWFLDRKLALGVDLYYRDLNFQSLDNIYSEQRLGARLSLTRALWSDYLIGSVSYTIEQVGIKLEPGYHGPTTFLGGGLIGPPGGSGFPVYLPSNVPQAILDEVGKAWVSRIGASIAYDTRNSTLLPDAGQRSELSAELAGTALGGDKSYYKIEAKSAWYFRGLAKGHVLEIAGRIGVADGLDGQDVPFYDRYYLGGLYSLRGFEYRAISPRDPSYGINPAMPNEPIGGDTYWFGTAEYSIPIIQKDKVGGVRVAIFYDVGSVMAKSYDFNFTDYSANWGFGLRLNLPIGPLRLDYGIPIKHDQFSDGSGRFQFGVGYTREF